MNHLVFIRSSTPAQIHLSSHCILIRPTFSKRPWSSRGDNNLFWKHFRRIDARYIYPELAPNNMINNTIVEVGDSSFVRLLHLPVDHSLALADDENA